ncbi:MAG: hypothetical protein ABI361_07230 [Nitrososphaera sp.]|jgi:hypothetical protein
MRSSVALFILTFAVMGLMLGLAAFYQKSSESGKPGGNTGLILSSEKVHYSRGGLVSFTAKNSGPSDLAFPDLNLGLSVKNQSTGQIYSPVSGQVITLLHAGESKTIEWADSGAGSGNYTASIHTASGYSPIASAQAEFSIS